MALPSTVHRFQIELSHVDRNLYQPLDLRLARHPSESIPFLVTRVLAAAFLTDEGLSFSKGGLSDPDEPALSIHTLDGRRTAWVEVGLPSAERLHKASKQCPRVVVFTHRAPELLRAEADQKHIHRREQLELYAVDEALLRALEPLVEKTCRWEVTFSDGQIYVVAGGATHGGTLQRV